MLYEVITEIGCRIHCFSGCIHQLNTVVFEWTKFNFQQVRKWIRIYRKAGRFIFIVITSYSIHYTKLYEWDEQKNASASDKLRSMLCSIAILDSSVDVIPKETQDPQPPWSLIEVTKFPLFFLQSILEGIWAFKDSAINRITSYNVCYTKLLRNQKIYS